jgi:recombinational DNA repair protein (RecF pathway)
MGTYPLNVLIYQHSIQQCTACHERIEPKAVSVYAQHIVEIGLWLVARSRKFPDVNAQ